MSSLKRNVNDNEINLSKVDKLLKVQVYHGNDYSKSYFAKTAIKRINSFFSHKPAVTGDANHA